MLGLRPSSRLVEAYFYFAGRDLIREKPGASSPTFVRLNGGLGNQLFQLAAGVYVAQEVNSDLILDPIGLEILRKRGLSAPREYELRNLLNPPKLAGPSEIAQLSKIAKIIRRQGETPIWSLFASLLPFLSKHTLEESGVMFEGDSGLTDRTIRSGEQPKYLVGYWADFKIAEELGTKFRDGITEGQIGVPDLSERIRETDGAIIHVRRGDFKNQAAAMHDVLPSNYYLDGIEVLGLANKPTFVFSDDIDWCREEFGSFKSFEFVEPLRQYSSFDYLISMSQGQSFLIPNSSFSWWAAWLSEIQEKRVVRPTKWVSSNVPSAETVFPKEWEVI